jgi:acetolactate synthase-1/2/3 large subunit
MTGAEMVIEALADQGSSTSSAIPAARCCRSMMRCFQQSNRLQHILVRHEQGLCSAAEGYARSTGRVGTVLVTSGPGATNAVTGLTDALCDSIRSSSSPGRCRRISSATTRFRNATPSASPGVHQAQTTWSRTSPPLPRAPARGVSYCRQRPPRPGRGRHSQGYPVRQGRILPAAEFQHRGYRPKVKGDLDKVKQAIDLMASASGRCSIPAAASSIRSRRE